MTTPSESALFEVLNAKKLSPEEVGKTFVFLPQFEQLVGPDHAYVVGPRGSGKTTLLRMLQGEALMEWEDAKAVEYRKRIRYSSVFLPADRLWVSQSTPVGASEATGQAFATSAFCTQMLAALIETLQYRLGASRSEQHIIHLPVGLSPKHEADLVTACAEAWRLPTRSHSLLGLADSLDLRLNNLATLLDPNSPEMPTVDLIGELPWLGLSPVEALRFGIRAINRYTRQPNHRWALLLDEMELAPRSVHKALSGALRGGERNLILKLSFSPFDRYLNTNGLVGGPVEGNDFKAIHLWYGNRLSGRRFAGGLWSRMAREATGSASPAEKVLGVSKTIALGVITKPGAYKQSSTEMELIKDMYKKDPTFRAYLRKRQISLDQVEGMSYNQRSASVRRMYPLLVFRDALLEFRNGRPEPRGRKKIPELFGGAGAVFAALEGNPRWMKAVFSNLLAAYDGGESVDPSVQYDALRSAAHRFESLLRVLPGHAEQYSFPLLDLLNAIGRYFHRRVLSDFTADPPLAFRVDARVPEEIQAGLKTALTAGAIVHLRSDRSPAVLSDLTGERFRIAYLLCVRDGFELPFRLAKSVDLSRILAEEVPSMQPSQSLRNAILLDSSIPLPFDESPALFSGSNPRNERSR